MLFAHDTEMALGGAVELVNTARGPVDTLATLDDLDQFARAWQWSGSRAHDTAELAAVQSLRPRLERIWAVGEDEAVLIINGLLQEFQALPQLVQHDGWPHHLHATPADAPLAQRMAVEAAMAFVDVVRGREFDRLRVCAAEDCRDVLVDLSKNRSRRFCGSSCANRTNVAAYRARKAHQATAS
jgi:predicted RNA-binding Zn ribbon-like protein